MLKKAHERRAGQAALTPIDEPPLEIRRDTIRLEGKAGLRQSALAHRVSHGVSLKESAKRGRHRKTLPCPIHGNPAAMRQSQRTSTTPPLLTRTAPPQTQPNHWRLATRRQGLRSTRETGGGAGSAISETAAASP